MKLVHFSLSKGRLNENLRLVSSTSYEMKTHLRFCMSESTVSTVCVSFSLMGDTESFILGQFSCLELILPTPLLLLLFWHHFLSLVVDIKKFVCSRCSRSFRQKVHLQTHMLTHTGEKNLQCSYCVKKFARESDRKQHQYQHTKEKVYQCTECLKVFYKLQNYKRHKLMHSGEKNHACPKCQKRFYTKYHLQRHSKTCKGAKTEIYLNKHEKNLNLEEMANELSACPSASRSNINSTAK